MENKQEQYNNLLTIVIHDIQSPLRFIKTITQDLADNCLIMDKETLQEHTKMVHNSIVSLQVYCNKISNWKKTKTELIYLNKPTNINEIFTDIAIIYTPLISAKKIIFNVIETNIYCFVADDILFTILINIIDNAYKNTTVGFISMEATIINNNISIIISDTGKGMEQKLIDVIIGNKWELNNCTLGYYIINDLLKKINGNIIINSKINEGTQIIITLSNPEKYDNAYQDS